MAVDRGGLQYRVIVTDEFSAALGAFRDSVRTAREEFRAFRAEARQAGTSKATLQASARRTARALTVEEEAQRKLTRELRRTAVEREKEAIARRRGIVTQAEVVRQQRLRVTQERLLQREQRRTARVERDHSRALAEYARRQQLAARAEAQRRSTAVAFATEQQRIARTTASLIEPLRNVKQRLEAVDRQGKRTGGTFQSLFFTFRRLVGVFAAFAIARALLDGFRSLVTESIRFNAQIETARLGISAVIAAAGDVRDALGGAADTAQQFAIAQREARRQVKLLRQDALATNATFEQLLDTFQVAIGPGLAAGLDIDEIRRLSIRISQAATAIGLPQNQLAEEIRSILSGTIQLRTTRLAAVLGITNEDVRNARELGQLTEFLNDRFEAFGVAGEESLRTFSVLITNVADAIRQVLAAGTEEVFDEVKLLLEDVFRTAGEVDDQLRITGLSPRAVALVRELANGLRVAVAEGRRLVEALQFEELLQTARAIGAVIGTVSRAAGAAIEGALLGLNDALTVVNAIAGAVSGIGRAFAALTGSDSLFSNILQSAIRLATLFGTLRLTFVAIQSLARLIFFNTLGRGALLLANIAQRVLGIQKSFIAISGALRFLLLSPVGLLFTGIAVALGVVLARTGIIQRTFSFFADDVERAEVATIDLAQRFEDLPARIAGGVGQLEKFAEQVREIDEELESVTERALFDLATVGLTGGIQQQRRALVDAQRQTLEETEAISRELDNAQADLVGTQRTRLRLTERVAREENNVRNIVEEGVEVATQQIQLERRRAQLQADAQSALLDQEVAIAEADGEGLRRARQQIVVAGQRILATERLIEANDEELKQLQTNLELASNLGLVSEEQRERIAPLIEEIVSAQGEEVVNQQRVNELTRAKLVLERQIGEAFALRIRALAAEETQRLSAANAELQVQADALQRLAQARTNIFDTDSTELQRAQAQNVLEAERARLDILRQQQGIERRALGVLLEKAEGTSVQNDLERQQEALLENQQLEREIINRRIAEAQRAVEVFRIAAEQPVRGGILFAVQEFGQSAANMFENTVQIMRRTFEGFTEFVSRSIVDAFNPQAQEQTILQRFGSLLTSIAQLITQKLVELATLRLLLGPFGVNPGTLGLNPGQVQGIFDFFSFHKGGLVGKRRGTPTPAHALAGGYAGGGGVGDGPPPGVHPKDTVAAWLQPGEFVHTTAAVREYGTAFMEAIRRRAVPRGLVHALMGSLSLGKLRARGTKGPGFQTGGAVAGSGSGFSAPTGPGGGLAVAAVAPTERNLARAQRGGRVARRRALAEDREFLRGMVTQR